MKHCLWLALPILLMAAPWAGTSPTQAIKPQPVSLQSATALVIRTECNGGERSCVIASGKTGAALALYVFDGHGNCIARDEPVAAKAADDVAVEWFPAATGLFTIELRNQSAQPNTVELAFR